MRATPTGSLTFLTRKAEGNILGFLCSQLLLHQYLLQNYHTLQIYLLHFFCPASMLWQKSPGLIDQANLEKLEIQRII